MLNMNSPTVQNLMQSGFNPYNNTGYIPQPQPIQQNYGYNPYMYQQQQPQHVVENWQYSYDPMPKVIVNEARGINSQLEQQPFDNYNHGNYYNNQVFNGYMNPILMKNQMESERLRQREEAIQQGKIWRALLKGREDDEDFDMDEIVQRVESMYYYEPPVQEMSIKEKIIVDKNNHIAELECKLQHYRENNIPIINQVDVMRANICSYYDKINSIIGDPDNCDIVDYFTRVYPELKHQQLMREAEHYSKNLKNRYNSNEFNKLIDKETASRPDSYYAKIMETFADNGVKYTNNDGIVITADEMEVKLPERLLKNSQDAYYDQRRKFFDAIFHKGGNSNG